MDGSAPAPVKLDTGKVRAALGDPDTPALVLFTIALSEFGPAVMGDEDDGIEQMDPAEMWAELHTRYGTWVPEEGENRLNALVTGLRGGLFWADLDVFMSVATALFDGDLGDLIDTGFENLSTTEIMWAMLEMELAWDSDETPDFSLDVQAYIDDALQFEQEDQEANLQEVDGEFSRLMDQMREIGVPAAMLRAWDEEYAAVMDEIEEDSNAASRAIF